MTIHIPEKVQYIIQTLMEHNFEAYAVGGCVRDTILGRNPEDWDITTSAKPEEVKALFRRTIDTGIQHGTVTVMLDREGFEVTTYRIDGEYEDNRRPKNVEFTTNLVEDLKRRDFTINAMAYNHKDGLVDEFNGLEDINRKRICCVGTAEDRFDEDALRMLRAIRFSGQLGFTVDQATREAILNKAENLNNISAERIRVELNKLITSKGPEQIREAYATGMTKVILPEFDVMMKTEQKNPHHCYTVGEHTIIALKELQGMNTEWWQQDDKLYSILCWTVLLHDVAKPACKTTDNNGIDHFYGHTEQGFEMVKVILKRLKFDNHTIDLVTRLVKWHDYDFTLKPAAIRKAANRIGEDIMMLLMVVKRADVLAQSQFMREEKLNEIEQAKAIYMDVLNAKQCLTLKSLAVNGQDLIGAGFPPGKQLGVILNQLLELVLETPELNQKDQLIDIADKQMR